MTRCVRPVLLYALAALMMAVPASVPAQQVDTTKSVADTTRRTPASARVVPSAARARFTPPLTPRGAFLHSLLLPGFGQARLDRGSSGALFASVELAALVMIRRSSADLREARRFRVDTLPAEFTVSGGSLQPTGTLLPRFTDDLIRTRRLHVEDWLAAIAFNHLFSAADAFVSAQLWDVPVQITAMPTATGAAFAATVRF